MRNIHEHIVANLPKNSPKLTKSHNISNYIQKCDKHKD